MKEKERAKGQALSLTEAEMARFDRLYRYLLRAAGARPCRDNCCEIITEGRMLYRELKEQIRSARIYIHILSYIIRPDEIFHALETELAKKAAEGVQVRILVDAIGSRKLHRRDYERLRGKGIRVEVFPGAKVPAFFCINDRNHRKIVVVDGRVGFVGGFNIGREYVGRNERLGHWRDTHLKLTGSAAGLLQRQFARDWFLTCREKLPASAFCLPGQEKPPGHSLVQIVSGGPDCTWKSIRDAYVRLFHLARHSIEIQTPYFIPDGPVLQALRMAALSGVDVRLMIPCKPDHPFVYRATCAWAGELLQAGARCYRYMDGFLHAKCVVVDGLICCCGTANLDIRSFRLNYESNALLYDRALAGKMEEIFREDLEKCREMTLADVRKRSLPVRLAEGFSRLLSPFL